MKKKIDPRLVTILLIVFVNMLGASMILPILPLYAQRSFSMQPEVITLLVSVFFAAQFIAGPYLGRWSDRFGRLPVLIISQIGTVISFLMLGFAVGPWMLFLARILDGITGGNIIVAQAYITDITPEENRTEALGYIFAVFGIGFVIGPALGGLLAAYFGARIPYFIAAGMALIVVLMTAFILDETVDKEAAAVIRKHKNGLSLRQAWANSDLALILLVSLVAQFGMGMLQSTFALFGEAVLFSGASEQTTNLGIGLLLATVGIGQFFTQAVLIRPMVRRFGESRLVVIGNLIRTVGLISFAIFSSPWIAGLASLAFAIGTGLTNPPLQTLATKSVPPEQRGGVLGIVQSSVSLATIISTAIAGMIFALNPTAPFVAGGGLTALALIPAIILMRRFRSRSLVSQG